MALDWVVELECLVDLLTAEIRVLSLLDLFLGLLGGRVLGIEAMDIVEFHGNLLSLVAVSACWDGALCEASLSVTVDILDALDRQLLGQRISLGLLLRA